MLITKIISCCYISKNLKKKCVEKSPCTPQSKVLKKKHPCVSIETLAYNWHQSPLSTMQSVPRHGDHYPYRHFKYRLMMFACFLLQTGKA